MSGAHLTVAVLVPSLGVLAGCVGLPRLDPVPPHRARAVAARCEALFPSGNWGVVHAIHARLPLGLRTALIGVARWEAQARRLRVLALALEGFTLLDLEIREGRLLVHRAVPPLDREGFAQRLAADVGLLLLRPEAGAAVVGRPRDGAALCRFRERLGRTVDVVPGPRGAFALRLYGREGRLLRIVEGRGGARVGFASELSLRAPGAGGYALRLRLLRVEPDGPDSAPPRREPPPEPRRPPPAPSR